MSADSKERARPKSRTRTRPSSRDDDVVGLEVAVDEARRVGGGEALAGLQHHGEHLAPRTLAGAQPPAQRLALHEFHDEVDLALELADLVHADDVGVGEPGHRLGLAVQAGASEAVALRGPQQLDGDLAVELVVVGRVDDAHAALADLLQDREVADPRRDDQLIGLGGG